MSRHSNLKLIAIAFVLLSFVLGTWSWFVLRGNEIGRQTITVNQVPIDPFTFLGLQRSSLSIVGIELAKASQITQVDVSLRHARSLATYDFPSRIPPKEVGPVLFRYHLVKFHSLSRSKRWANCWLVILLASTRGLHVVVSTEDATSWTALVIDASSGELVSAFDGTSIVGNMG